MYIYIYTHISHIAHIAHILTLHVQSMYGQVWCMAWSILVNGAMGLSFISVNVQHG